MPGETARAGLELVHGGLTHEIIGAYYDVYNALGFGFVERADLIVDGKVIVESKVAAKILPIHEIQLVNYLKATTITVGLILNFGPQPAVRRLVLSFPRGETALIRC